MSAFLLVVAIAILIGVDMYLFSNFDKTAKENIKLTRENSDLKYYYINCKRHYNNIYMEYQNIYN